MAEFKGSQARNTFMGIDEVTLKAHGDNVVRLKFKDGSYFFVAIDGSYAAKWGDEALDSYDLESEEEREQRIDAIMRGDFK